MFNLSERQVNYRTKKWGLDYSKKKKLNEDFFKIEGVPQAYWAGMLASDGWIETERDRVGLALKTEDLQHLEKFKSAMDSSHDICPFMSGIAYRIRFNSATMVRDLADKYNITSSKTYSYTLPVFTDNELMWAFLHGYMDGDGHYSISGSGRPKIHLCSANKAFLEDFREICSLQVGHNITQEVYLNLNKKGSCYSLALTLNDSLVVLRALYSNSTEETRLSRKFNTIQKYL